MKIYLGSDHQGFHLKEKVFAYLSKRGYEVEDVGDKELDPEDDFPEFAQLAVLKVLGDEDDDARAYAASILLAFLDIEISVRQQVDLVEQHDGRVMEHLGVLERFVFPFGDGKNDDLVVFSQVEGGRADQIADIFDQQYVKIVQVKVLGAVHNHVGIQMAPGAGVDLAHRDSGSGDALGIVIGLLVAFDDGEAEFVRQVTQGPFQQGCLAGAG